MCQHNKHDYPKKPGAVLSGRVSEECGSKLDGKWVKFNSVCYLFNDHEAVDFFQAEKVEDLISICNIFVVFFNL